MHIQDDELNPEMQAEEINYSKKEKYNKKIIKKKLFYFNAKYENEKKISHFLYFFGVQESQLRYNIHPQSYNKEQYNKEVYNKEQYKESGSFPRELQSSYSREYKELATPFLVTDILEEPCRDT